MRVRDPRSMRDSSEVRVQVEGTRPSELAPKIANAPNGPSMQGYPARSEDRVPLNRAPAMRLSFILCRSRTLETRPGSGSFLRVRRSRTIETRPHSEAVSRAPRVANPLNAPHTEAAPHPPRTANPRNAPPLLGFSACPEGREVSERTPAIRLAHIVRGSCALEVRPRSGATPRYPGVGNRRGALLL